MARPQTRDALYCVRSGSPHEMGEVHRYQKAGDAKKAARKKFEEWEDHLLRFDKAAHVKLRATIADLDQLTEVDSWSDSPWKHASVANPMQWQAELGYGVILRVEMWKDGNG